MESQTGIFIAVPEELVNRILQEGYRCTNRNRVPAHRNRDEAIRAYRRHHYQQPTLLTVSRMPLGVRESPHRGGVKLETRHLPASCLARVERSHSFSMGAPTPSLASGLPRAMTFGYPSVNQSIPRMSLNDRQQRLQRNPNLQTLHHATGASRSQQILRSREFRAGTRGFLGPGIYFSRQPQNALRWCQCREHPRVVIVCRVRLGRVMQVDRGHHTGMALRAANYDSYEEIGRDCFMLPDNADGQIDMDSLYVMN